MGNDPLLQESAVVTSQRREQRTVLVIEDDEDTRYALTALLARQGFLVLTAATGHDAMGILEEPLSPIDMVLLDVHLPDVDGTALCARLRELDPNLPILVCTGEADEIETAQLARLGALRFFHKPIAATQLLETVETVLS
jgi:DNA-binding response OmpR family regulator